ncbi:Ferric reductase like transmembrane component [Ceratobasidium sp. AG-Ba]|nr:Ferric reductase like transmembrane component [Ceratobasidium sp. AG-Ba]QRV99645.1 Ferric reductase like transmembrane component [Ceratobasidium sp. AG-Ba]QRW14179.1 Ferric reductase like transmembrane component [Ceratobasidium sp. AG-Ba]
MFQLQCGESCNGVIDAWKLPCTPSAKHSHHTVSRERMDCQASYQPYLQSLAYCLKDKCFAEPWHEVEHYWRWLQVDRDSKWPPLLETIPDTAPPLAPVGMKMLNDTPMRVRDEVYDFDYATAQAFAWNERWHERASYILVFTILSVLLIGAFRKVSQRALRGPYNPSSLRSSKFTTMVQKHIIRPAMFNGSQSAPIWRGIGYLPSRIMVAFLLFFLGATAIANSAPYKSVQPNNWAINRRQEMMGFVANRAGLISFALIPVTILLSARNNPLLWMTGWSPATMITLHRWTARMAAFQAVIHSVGWTVQWYWNTGNWSQYMEEGALPYMQWGFLATVVICVMVLFAMLPFRRWSYEIFLIFHILFAAFLIAGCYYHMVFRFKWRYGYLNWIYVAIGIWLADRTLRMISVWKNGLQGSIGRTADTATAELIQGSTQNIIKLTVFPRLERNTIQPGSHYYAYFPTLQSRRPWENHPFSVATWALSDSPVGSVESDDKGSSSDLEHGKGGRTINTFVRPHVTILVKPHSGVTRALLERIQGEPGSIDLPISLEGPYGERHPLDLYETVVLIAGGIGVTPALAYTQDLISRDRHVKLVWASRDAGLINAVRSMLPEGVEANIYYTGVPTRGESTQDAPGLRPDLTKLVCDEAQMDRPGRIAFFVCGPAGMVDQVRTACVNVLGDDVPADKVGFFEESFAW